MLFVDRAQGHFLGRAAHEWSGAPVDGKCQRVRYSSGYTRHEGRSKRSTTRDVRRLVSELGHWPLPSPMLLMLIRGFDAVDSNFQIDVARERDHRSGMFLARWNRRDANYNNFTMRPVISPNLGRISTWRRFAVLTVIFL